MSHIELEEQMKKIISNLKPGTEFLLKDIINDPPMLLGRRLYESVKSGKIADVDCIGTEDGRDKYIKL